MEGVNRVPVSGLEIGTSISKDRFPRLVRPSQFSPDSFPAFGARKRAPSGLTEP